MGGWQDRDYRKGNCLPGDYLYVSELYTGGLSKDWLPIKSLLGGNYMQGAFLQGGGALTGGCICGTIYMGINNKRATYKDYPSEYKM